MHQFYVLNAPDNVPLSRPYTLQILPEYTSFIVEIRPKFARFAPQMRRKRIANRPFSARILPNFCQQFTRFLPVFRPAESAMFSLRPLTYMTCTLTWNVVRHRVGRVHAHACISLRQQCESAAGAIELITCDSTSAKP